MDVCVDGKNIDLAFAAVPGVDRYCLDLISGVGIDEGLRTGGQSDATASAIPHDKHDSHFARLFAEDKIATATTELEYLQVKIGGQGADITGCGQSRTGDKQRAQAQGESQPGWGE